VGTQTIEVERKFDVGADFVLPDLAGLDGVASLGVPDERLLDAVYYDTPDLRLSRASVTLRRRTGGHDAGWHVKLPVGDDARRELRHPLGRAAKTPPRAVVAPVAGLVRRAPMGPIAELRTRRTAIPLLDTQGRVLAEIADDHVTATAYAPHACGPAAVTAWRELEVELVDGEPALLELVAAALLAGGARHAAADSKLKRALADRLGDADGAADPRCGSDRGAAAHDRTKRKDGTPRAKRVPPDVGEVLVAALRAQVAALQRADVMVRTEAADGVHQLRVASRRLRSILAAYRPLLERDRVEPVRDELRWLGAELSAARDAEVSLAHLRALVAAQPPELVLGPVAARLQQADLSATSAGRKKALRALGDARYFALVDTLVDLVADPPLTGKAGKAAAAVTARAIARAAERLRRHVRTAAATADPQAHEQAMHDVRKAAKRLRYTAEVPRAILGDKRSARVIRAGKDLQKVLGERQDTVLTREQCGLIGLQAFAAGENAFTYGRMHALEQARAERAEQRFQELWPTVARRLKRATTKA
jgi:CHAD domain-containing protein